MKKLANDSKAVSPKPPERPYPLLLPTFNLPLFHSQRIINRLRPRSKRFIALGLLRRLSLPLELPIRKSIENGQTRGWTYRSQHFKFVSNAPLRDHVVREFTALFELTHLYCSHLPFELHRLRSGQRNNLQVRLIENYSHYLREGGAPGSGGIYLTEPDLILVPFEGLGLEKKNDSYALDPTRSNQTLMHEATHMMMRGPLLKDGWFVEGAAEYVATIPMRKNTLLIENHRESIKSYICLLYTSPSPRDRG